MNMEPREKRLLLVQLIEKYVQSGYDISDLVGRPLSYFNWGAIQKLVNENLPEEV